MANFPLFQELKRRNVLRAVVLYAGAVWAFGQGLSQFSPALGLPDWATRWFLIATAIGFPFWIAFAWFYEFTPQGIKRESEIAPGESITHSTARKLDFAIIGVLSVAVVLLLTNTFVWHKGAGVSGGAVSAPIPVKSIAVLPLVNESGDPREQYFSDGLSEDLITALSQFAGLKVISRNSSFQFRDSKDDAKTIGAKLGVAHLLEGSVRRTGDEVRVSAELVNAADGSTLWSQHYDRPYQDLFKLQDDITHAVAGALKAKLLATSGAVVQTDRPPSGSLAAWKAYLQGNFYYDRISEKSLPQAIYFYQQAIAHDPKYAAAYAALSHAWARLASGGFLKQSAMQLAYAKASAAADEALALDPDMATAHEARGYVLYFTLNWREAEDEFRRGLSLAPGNAQAMRELALALATLGRLDEAVQLQRDSIAVNPLDDAGYYDLAIYLSGLDQPESAADAMREALSLQPTSSAYHAVLAAIEIQRGDTRSALQAAEAEQAPIWRTYALALAYTAAGDQTHADAALQELTSQYADDAAYRIARIYAFRRQPDDAFVWLDRAWRQHDSYIRDLLYDPFLLRYKSDPRFAAFCKKVGLPTTTDAKAMP